MDKEILISHDSSLHFYFIYIGTILFFGFVLFFPCINKALIKKKRNEEK